MACSAGHRLAMKNEVAIAELDGEFYLNQNLLSCLEGLGAHRARLSRVVTAALLSEVA